MKKFWADFKKFISRGNVLDMAVGVIVGSAFSAIVTSLTNKIIMPLINMLLSIGGNGLESAYTMLKVVKDENGAVDLAKSIYIDWGAFITAIINFFIIAFTLFVIIRVMMNARGYIEKAVKSRLTKEQKLELLIIHITLVKHIPKDSSGNRFQTVFRRWDSSVSDYAYAVIKETLFHFTDNRCLNYVSHREPPLYLSFYQKIHLLFLVMYLQLFARLCQIKFDEGLENEA